MLFVCHARIFTVIEDLARKFGALAACLIAFLIDGAVIHRADVYSKIL